MKIKYWVPILLIVFIFSFTGCKTTTAETTAAATTTAVATTAIAETTATPIPAPKTQTIFYDGTAFSDDVAWVRRSKPEYINDPGGGWECIDDKGNTLFTLGETSFPLTVFIDGAASIATNNAYDYTECDDKIVNKSGKVIFPKDNTYKYHYLISSGAYTFVERYINTIEKTEKQTGIVDNTGKWVIEPTPDLSAAINPSSSFLEHGIIKASYQGNDFYDANSNEFFKSSIAQGNEDNYLELARRLVENNYKEDLCFLHNYDSGLGVQNAGNAGADFTKLGFNNKGTGFYDRNKNMAIDLSSYQDAEAVGGFSDGYCSVMLKNPQGNTFYTVIDNKGNQMFEPIPVGGSSSSGSVSCGCIFIYQGDYKGYYIDVKGKTVIPNILPVLDPPFRVRDTIWDFSKNGLAKVRSTNLDMTICYIDTNGNIAF